MARARKPAAAAKPKAKRVRRQPKRILNCVPSLETEDDWRIDTAEDAGVARRGAEGSGPEGPAPVVVADRRPGQHRLVRRLGARPTASCAGTSSRPAGSRRASSSRPGSSGSRRRRPTQFNTRPTTFVEAEGTSLKAALDVSRKFGAVKDAVLPFATGQLYNGNAQTFYAVAAQLKISMYFNLGRDLDNWRTWLATKGPILTRLNVDSTWGNATANKGKLELYKPQTAKGGHAVTLVGYTPETFIVRNSWGTGWGDRGFAHASLGYAQAAFTEAYGVEV